MESEYKLFVMHEQSSSDFSNSDNLVITETLHTHQHSSHTLAKLDIKSLTNDNHKQEVTEHNQSAFNNNRTLTKATNTVVRGIVDFKMLNTVFNTPRHEYREECSAAAAVVLNYSEDSINNNNSNNNSCDVISTSNTSLGVGVMSHKNFVLSFEHQQTPSPLSVTDTLLSPAEAPFGRRYAEISQFKNHPNVEW